MSGLSEALFVSDATHERTIKLADGSEHVFHFKELTSKQFRHFAVMERSDDDNKKSESMALLISASLCDASGKAVLTAKDAGRLKPAVSNAMVEKILEINGIAGNG